MRKMYRASPYTVAGVIVLMSVLFTLLVYVIAWGNGSTVRLAIASAATALIVTPIFLGMCVFAWFYS